MIYCETIEELIEICAGLDKAGFTVEVRKSGYNLPADVRILWAISFY